MSFLPPIMSPMHSQRSALEWPRTYFACSYCGWRPGIDSSGLGLNFLSSRRRVRNPHLKRRTFLCKFSIHLHFFFQVSQETVNHSPLKSTKFYPTMFPVFTSRALALTLSFLYAAVLVYSQPDLCLEDDLLIALQANREAAEEFCRADLQVPDIYNTYILGNNAQKVCL